MQRRDKQTWDGAGWEEVYCSSMGQIGGGGGCLLTLHIYGQVGKLHKQVDSVVFVTKIKSLALCAGWPTYKKDKQKQEREGVNYSSSIDYRGS